MPRVRSEGVSRRLGQVGAAERVSRASFLADYEVTAAHIATPHNPSDKRDIPIQDATLISRGCGRAGLQSTIE